MIDELLLGAISPRTFVDEYLFKLPLAMAGGCQSAQHLGTWEIMDELLSHPDANVIVAREGGPDQGAAPRSGSEARKLAAAGCTIGVRHAQRIHAGLAELARRFYDDFLAPVDVHVYATPAGFAGFGWHYDAEEVFILQTEGVKDWWLRKNTVNPWPLVETLPTDMKYEREIMPLFQCSLAAGDWLYIPTGYWHRTEARQESISLSVGIEAHTGISLFDFLRARLLDSLKWRERLPIVGRRLADGEQRAIDALAQHFSALGQDLARLLDQPALARAFLEAQTRDDAR